ncbi:MAG: rhodanese-like domain-containing protein [Hyphomicrobium sp.]|nr:rhodanese-like domain-containing protein [Hyphomicrobium sp.]
MRFHPFVKCFLMAGLLLAMPIARPAHADAGVSSGATAPHPLVAVMEAIRKDHPKVARITPEAFAALPAEARADIVILDVREDEEFRVSHIDGARRAAPGMNNEEFSRSIGLDVRGKPIYVYCSVGRRSARFAERMAKAASAAGATGITSIEGGIFRWHNEGRPLVNASGPTTEVHGYDRTWGRLVDDGSKAVLTPGGPPIGN